MASGYPPDFPPDEKTPQYSAYPAPVYSAPSYQETTGPQPFNAPHHPPEPPVPASSGPSNGDNHDCGGEQRRQSAASYDDVFRLSKPVEITFQEVFREAKGSESPEAIFQVNHTIFNYTARGLYIFLSVVLGILLSFVWGIAFGVLNFVVTWLAQPALKMMFMLLRIAANAFGPIFRAFLDPFFQSWGHIFSKIRGAFTLNVNGLVFPKKEKRKAIREEA